MIKQHLAWVVTAAIAWNVNCVNSFAAPVAPIDNGEAAVAESNGRISWKTFQATPLSKSNPSNNQARIVFLRSGLAQPTATPANVFVNGRFHSAVLPGAYAELQVCAGSHHIELQSENGTVKSPRLTVQLKSQQIIYIAVNDPRADPPLRTLGASELPPDTGRLQRQNHAISRVPAPKDCTPQDIQQETRYSLGSEMLFHFGKSDVQDLLSTGEAEIMRLARKIRQEHARIVSVQVIGHTDPMGAKDLNLRLSQKRAQTVRNILVAAGLPAERVNAKGVGDSQLLVSDCASKRLSRTEMLGCNQLNRRVEVLVLGIQY